LIPDWTNFQDNCPGEGLGRRGGREKFDWQEACKFDCQLVRTIFIFCEGKNNHHHCQNGHRHHIHNPCGASLPSLFTLKVIGTLPLVCSQRRELSLDHTLWHSLESMHFGGPKLNPGKTNELMG